MRQQVKISVLEKSVFGSMMTDDYGDDLVVDVISGLQSVLNQIPEEFRETAQIQVSTGGDYEGSHHTEIEIYYYRPETDSEMNERLRRDEETKNRKEEKERAQYEALKRKYGDDAICDAFWQEELKAGYDVALKLTAEKFGKTCAYVERLLSEQDALNSGNG